MCTTISASTFIEHTLIGEYGDIVNEGKHDYLSFLLIACGIEFLGRCMESEGTDWQDPYKSRYYFGRRMSLFKQDYDNLADTLYKELRCGFCHSLLPEEKIIVSSKKPQDLNCIPICLNLHTFFNDFKDACNALLNDDAHKDRLNQLFLAASQDSSGATITTINKGE